MAPPVGAAGSRAPRPRPEEQAQDRADQDVLHQVVQHRASASRPRRDRADLLADVASTVARWPGRNTAAAGAARRHRSARRVTHRRRIVTDEDTSGVARRLRHADRRRRVTCEAGAEVASSARSAGAEPYARRRAADVGVLLCHGFTGSPRQHPAVGRAPRGGRLHRPAAAAARPRHARWQEHEQDAAGATGTAAVERALRRAARALPVRCSSCGLSMGGTLALRLAEQHPDRGRRASCWSTRRC